MSLKEATTAIFEPCTVCGKESTHVGYCAKHQPILYAVNQHTITITGVTYEPGAPTVDNTAELITLCHSLDRAIVKHTVRTTSVVSRFSRL